MPKAYLQFNLPMENEEFKIAQNASNMHCALLDIQNYVFRPARKHGYSDDRIRDLLEKLGPEGVELVGELEKLFFEKLTENDVTI